jgi:hypothetical protein
MRTLILVSALLALAACSDDDQATAPAFHPISNASVVPAASAGVVQSAKPVQGPTGFTQVSTDSSAVIISVAGGAVAGQAYCPAGSVLTGGGYVMINEGNWQAPPVVTQNYSPYPNMWWVRIMNAMPGASNATFRVFVRCIS